MRVFRRYPTAFDNFSLFSGVFRGLATGPCYMADT